MGQAWVIDALPVTKCRRATALSRLAQIVLDRGPTGGPGPIQGRWERGHLGNLPAASLCTLAQRIGYIPAQQKTVEPALAPHSMPAALASLTSRLDLTGQQHLLGPLEMIAWGWRWAWRPTISSSSLLRPRHVRSFSPRGKGGGENNITTVGCMCKHTLIVASSKRNPEIDVLDAAMLHQLHTWMGCHHM